MCGRFNTQKYTLLVGTFLETINTAKTHEKKQNTIQKYKHSNFTMTSLIY